MKKITLLLAFIFTVTFMSFAKANEDGTVYTKIINSTSADFDYKVNGVIYTIEVGETEPFAQDEGALVYKRDGASNWVLWFTVSETSHMGQTFQIADVPAN